MNDPLDGPNAAPDHHRVIFENDRVRVLETVIRAGETAPVHTHLVGHVLIVEGGSRFIRRDPDGNVLLDTRTLGPDWRLPRVGWSDGLPAHSLENIGDDDIVAYNVELKGG